MKKQQIELLETGLIVVWIIACVLWLYLMCGCTYLENHRDLAWQSYGDFLRGYPPVANTYDITIPFITIHVVRDGEDMPEGHENSVSVANLNTNEIWIIGKRVGDQIWLPEIVLGEEVMHLLAGQRPEVFVDPDIFR